MGNNNASLECHRWVREVLKGCEGVAQIKDDILVHGTDDTHEDRLRKVLHKLQEAGFTLRRVKCELGMIEVEWFGHRFSGDGMRVAPDKADIIRQWPRPVTVREVKSFLAMLQFNAVYLATEKGEKTYTQLADPFREAVRRKKEVLLDPGNGRQLLGAEEAAEQ